jgi:hypothetical protein
MREQHALAMTWMFGTAQVMFECFFSSARNGQKK